ncbi:MAG: F0F1 ATP synthase subunit B [Candidatus Limnocylindrales bacterium]
MGISAVALSGLGHAAATLAAATGGEASGLVFNGFWILIAALNFIFFLLVLQQFAFGPIGRMLDERKRRIEQGLKDADQARREREQAADEKQQLLAAARRDANDIVARAQKSADEVRAQELAATNAEVERRQAQATAEIEAQRQRAMGEVRAQIADLALQAAGKVVGETRTAARERRLVDEFLASVTPGPAAGAPGAVGPAGSAGPG